MRRGRHGSRGPARPPTDTRPALGQRVAGDATVLLSPAPLSARALTRRLTLDYTQTKAPRPWPRRVGDPRADAPGPVHPAGHSALGSAGDAHGEGRGPTPSGAHLSAGRIRGDGCAIGTAP